MIVADYEMLDQPGRLAEAMSRIPDGPVVIDTEFVRERTYFARLCLVQVGADGRILLVDPIAIEDLGPLRELLRSGRPKVVHAARQDVEVLLPVIGAPLAPLFDTQVAAGLLGYPAQVGYAELVRLVLGVELAKGHARTDWAARPLSSAQLVYAADDVRYLMPVRDVLLERLEEAGRRAWLEEDCAALSAPEIYRQDPDDAWQRMKGLERMRPEERAVIRSLARWRERRAIERDLPRGWVLPDEALRELASARPASRGALERVASLPPRTASRFGAEILAAIESAAADSSDTDPAAAQERPTPEQLEQMKRLQQVLRTTAEELGVVPEVLATRRDLAGLIRGSRDVAPLAGWRREVIGERLVAAL